MILDALLQFSNNQALTATAASTDSIDVGEARDLGAGQPLKIGVFVTTAFTDTGSDSAVTVTVETDDNASFTTPLTAQTLGTIPALAAVGYTLIGILDPGKIDERYVRLKYTMTGGDLTTGAVKAVMANDIGRLRYYPDAFAIS